jgi:hypothetical protein
MTEGPDPLGKRALFWMPVEATTQDERSTNGERSARPRRARPMGKHALYTEGGADGDLATAPSGDPMPERGVFTVTCSACGQVSRIGLLDLLVLQFPIGIWFPGRTFDHKMTCPACRRRAWLSVTLFP